MRLAPLNEESPQVVSSIIPIEAETGFRRFISSHDMTPGLRCGSNPVSSSTRTAIARVNAGRKLTPFRRLKTDPLVVMVPRLTTLARGRGRGL